ncbi:MAG: YdeI/OmpD-associated family protein [Actinobacteria bacterium]|nr:YdeI/OmpD-associated family protein [Actinomycetota bacterium]
MEFPSRDAWASWLLKHHDSSSGVWVKIAKKSSAIESVSYADALDVALCHGWIDGQKDKLDADCWLQRFTPRRPGSRWSQRNCAKALDLIDKGEMRDAGLREVERAKADGRWDAAYAGQSAATVPDDLRRALDRNNAAKKFFESLDSRNRYAILYRVQEAKKPETRARRIEQFVAMLHDGKKIHP